MAKSNYNAKKRQKELARQKKQEEKRLRKQAKDSAEAVESEKIQSDGIEDLSA